MSSPWTIESLSRFFRMTDDADVHDGFWWRADEPQYEPFKILINCNDLFWWACADCEEVTPYNLAVLEQAFIDVRGCGPEASNADALLLFCARVRGMRPQGAFYECFPPLLAALFDAAGPPRGGRDDTARRAFVPRSEPRVTMAPPWRCRTCVGREPDPSGGEGGVT